MHSNRTVQRTTLIMTLLWLAFVIRGFWYCALLPPWEGYDEPFHFAALQRVASGQGLPHADSPISLEVQKSLHLLPLPWELRFHMIPPPLTSHEEYWKLPLVEREQRVDAVRELAPQEGTQPAAEPILNYESQQAPLYYWVFAIPLRRIAVLPLLSRVYLLRILTMLLASLAIPVGYGIARRVLRTEPQALGVTAIIVLLPELMISVTRVSNESPALVCFTVMLAAAVAAVHKPLSWSAWLLLGAALGCGLLSKAYVMSALPAVVVVGVLAVWRPSDTGQQRASPVSIILRLAAAFAATAIVAGKWYAGVHRTTGSWTGVIDDVAISHLSVVQKLGQVPHVNWKSGVLSILISHVWFGAWSFLRVPNEIYVLGFGVIGMAIVGVVVRLRRGRGTSAQMDGILVLSAFYIFFWAGLAYSVLVTFMNQGVSSSTGWYLYTAVAAEVILLVWGLQAFASARLVFLGLAVCAATLDLYGTHALLMPYYTGLTSHIGKSVPGAFWATATELPTVFRRLAELRPPRLNATALVFFWCGYWIATLAMLTAIFMSFRGSAIEKDQT